MKLLHEYDVIEAKTELVYHGERFLNCTYVTHNKLYVLTNIYGIGL